jgi:hypothetical protein
MISLLLKWKQYLTLGISLAFILWLGYTIWQNKSLITENITLSIELKASQQALEAMAKAKVASDIALTSNKKDKDKIAKDLSFTQTELRKLRNEIQDKCLDTDVPDLLLNRM